MNTREIKIGDLLYDENRFGLVIRISKATAFIDTIYYIEWNDGRLAQEQTRFVRYARQQATDLKRKIKRCQKQSQSQENCG